MNIQNLSLTISAGRIDQIPKDSLKQAIIAGRSNVGKSSFINCILNRKGFARTSSSPGKTATINFYNVDDCLHIVDLPGYGYAKVSKAEQQKWATLIDGFLRSLDERAKLMVLLVDLRHKPTELDRTMAHWTKECGVPYIVVCTKADKLSKKQAEENLEVIRRELELSEDVPLIAFSAETKTGKDEVIKILFNL